MQQLHQRHALALDKLVNLYLVCSAGVASIRATQRSSEEKSMFEKYDWHGIAGSPGT